MASIKAPDDLPLIITRKFNAAKEAGALTFYPTQLSVLQCGERNIPFQVRFSPALANKPKSNKEPNEGKKQFDPFLDPPDGLLVCELPPSHIIVLNKFAIVPGHFILATKEFKEQTHILEEEDLAAAYACLKTYRGHGKLFAFFNSGEHSGASQPHRHIQFLPIQSMMDGVDCENWRPLVESIDAMTSTLKSELPFTYFASSLSGDPPPAELHQIYKVLHEKSCLAVQNYILERPGCGLQLQSEENGSSPISYNIGLTDDVMVLCPRISEGKNIMSKNGNSVGPIALNGTLLAGTLLVKSEAEWDAIRDDKSNLVTVLSSIGIPPVHQQDGKL